MKRLGLGILIITVHEVLMTGKMVRGFYRSKL